MQRQTFSQDEHMVASAVAALASCKRGREDSDVEMKDCKMAKTDNEERPLKPVKKAPVIRVLHPAPFFFYRDFSQEPDDDPLTPLTAPGRVPNFPGSYFVSSRVTCALRCSCNHIVSLSFMTNFVHVTTAKMHAILSRTDVKDVVAWLPHGRSWRILKPREFEIKILPTYFDHNKFSSFVRQANGWGFRR
jgi:HSF-type DNA-binding